ncbi:MAG: hypothetical protein OEZ39_02550 [Gammaproteobacteria bacterium]|nr:hypothetical protein [Gammaproteobacteria bacterium]
MRRYIARLACLGIVILATSACGGGGGGSSSAPPTEPAPLHLLRADAGNIIGVRINETAVLDGSASTTALPDPLRYQWQFTHKPYGSQAILLNATSPRAGFVPDVEGTYMVQLVVSAGNFYSQRAIASVEASVAGWYTGPRPHMTYTSRCTDCHDGHLSVNDDPIRSTLIKAGTHLGTTNVCEACHTTFGYNRLPYVDHKELFGKCSTCHNGVLAVAKSPAHVATNAECDNCHHTESFLELRPDGSFDHSGITNACNVCHNGVTALGKHEAHPVTATECGACHTTTSFKNAHPDHTGPEVVGRRCDSCHNPLGGGYGARDVGSGHPGMPVDCAVCHTTVSFNMGGVFNHRSVDAAAVPCFTCHNDNNSINARGKAAATNHRDTALDCGVCHGVGGGNFANAIYDHTGVTTNCGSAGCHDPNTTEGQYAAGIHHVPSNGNDCENCHAPGNFANGTFDHVNVENDLGIRCDSCHNDIVTAGKHQYHIPTADDCRACHSGTITFVGGVFSHAGITNGCAICHDGRISTGKSLNHMPTTQDCSVCHQIKFDNFTGGTFDHLVGVNNNCADCHNGVIALGKTPNHIPSQTECSQCHQATGAGGFLSSTFFTDVHPAFDNGCEGCHKPQFLSARPTLLKNPTTHIPTTQDCHFCHTNDVFAPNIFSHAGITGNCVSCHDGNYAVPQGALGKHAAHMLTALDCGVCHGVNTSFALNIYDHTGRTGNCSECHGDGAAGAVTKKTAGHVPTTEDCSLCHVPGTFTTAVFNHTGITGGCAACHDGPAAVGTVKSVNHLPTTDDCAACHNTTAFAGARFDHAGVTGNCAICHDTVIAMGKDTNHVPTNDDCSQCHQTTGFVPATFDHTGITGNCQACHDGVLAIGKTQNHLLTAQDCGVCHTTTAFLPATFDHSTVTAADRCDACHIDGSPTRTGKDDKQNPAHLPTTLDCRACHTTATFVGGSWQHEASTAGQCNTCHSTTGGATPQPPVSAGHIDTNLQCDVCHTTNGWAPTGFSHSPTGNYPGDHRRAPTCNACHGNTITLPFVYPFPAYAPDCAACHANSFRRVGDHNGGENGTIEQNKDCSGGGRGCHSVNDRSF